jgi:hypothetical protein
MILMRETSITKGHWKGWAQKIETFLGPEICILAFVGTGSLVGWLIKAKPLPTTEREERLFASRMVVECGAIYDIQKSIFFTFLLFHAAQKAGRHQIVETIELEKP